MTASPSDILAPHCGRKHGLTDGVRITGWCRNAAKWHPIDLAVRSEDHGPRTCEWP
ncbi:hypothetical protein [Paracidovorax cattleyae]|uniref:Uncharacterized protein n=1 Tax=Paracidovorax cattleyae TaxID=80868 RepID=A0A1H0QGA6_9BURK|nr:hypothetical protein [Paracidovorax cattleyae]MBF9265723.1 hypothetical protein [Paracidovorax cattleyae]SDP16367.1 hypothetical protein SAMN04489708_10896 [Paracidovorax cattleyae]